MSDLRFRVGETSDLAQKEKTPKKNLRSMSTTAGKVKNNWKKTRRNSGPTPVARGGSGATAPLFAAPPVASSPGSPLPHLLDGHRKIVRSSAIPARSCPGPVQYHWGSIIELEVPPDETPELMTLRSHNTNAL